MVRLLSWLLLLATAAPERARIILDTDIGPDVDDAGTVAMLHALADRGEAEPLAVMCNTRSEWGAPALQVINTWYGRPELPVGTLKGPGHPGTAEEWFGHSFNEHLAKRCPNGMRSGRNAPDAIELYQRLLRAQPDRSVTIVSVGNLTNLRDLLDTAPDLVAAKVKQLVVMAGRYPKSKPRDPNFFGDIRASMRVVEAWPTPVMFTGTEIGERIETGAVLSKAAPRDNPVRIAFELWDEYFMPRFEKRYLPGGDIRPHDSYDQTALLYGVRGLAAYWRAKTGGTNFVKEDGSNEWRPTPKGRHGYLVELMEPARLAKVIDALQVQPPARKPPGWSCPPSESWSK